MYCNVSTKFTEVNKFNVILEDKNTLLIADSSKTEL